MRVGKCECVGDVNDMITSVSASGREESLGGSKEGKEGGRSGASVQSDGCMLRLRLDTRCVMGN